MENLVNIKEEKILNLINRTKKAYLNNTVGFTMGEKTKYLGHTIKDLSNQIAGYYYPTSKYPLYELTFEEILSLFAKGTPRSGFSAKRASRLPFAFASAISLSAISAFVRASS